MGPAAGSEAGKQFRQVGTIPPLDSAVFRHRAGKATGNRVKSRRPEAKPDIDIIIITIIIIIMIMIIRNSISISWIDSIVVSVVVNQLVSIL